MNQKEQTNRLKRLMIAGSKLGVILFRNNVAKAWVSSAKPIIIKKRGVIDVFEGDVVLRRARILHAGLFKGSHDLIGYKTVEITPEMVGSKLAVFTGVEDKSKGDRIRAEQHKFHAAIERAGGYSVVARSVDDLEDYFKN